MVTRLFTFRMLAVSALFFLLNFGLARVVTAVSSEVVLYTSDVTVVRGNWAATSSPESAGGQQMLSVDKGWSTTSNPLALPNDYFEATFDAAANTSYHVWLRLRAANNNKYNDSVFVQFSDSVNAANAPIYRIGTTDGLMVNLENCSACGMSAWGWQDKAWWTGQSPVVQFTGSGPHTIRVQTREDGVQVDQIVLSPSMYLSTAPGQVVNDATIVPKPLVSPIPPSSLSPYTGSPAVIPGTIQAEDFDNGGEGVAYHDTSSGNAGGSYRQTDVDLEPASGGGYDVGWIAAGEWLRYTVNVATGGSYVVNFRVAALGQGGTFHLEMNGVNVTGPMTIPNTGGWQAWQMISKTVSLSAGQQSARLVMDTAGDNAVGNIDSLQFVAAPPTPTPTASVPYNGAPSSIPGTIEAENFDDGGEGVAYHDVTPGNSGGQYRQTDVDIEPASGGGYNVGWIGSGEWLQYTVNVAPSGSYVASFRVASSGQGGTFHLEMNGVDVSGTLTIPNTGGWQAWQTITKTVSVTGGRQLARVVFDTAGDIAVGNLDSIQFAASTPTPPVTPTGAIINVPAGGDLQAAINAAQPGDTILLAPGVTYTGNFTLPAKGGSSYITIRSSAPDSVLPGEGVRIMPSFVSQLPRIKSAVMAAAFLTATGAHHYRLQFLEIVGGWEGSNLVELGDSAQNALWMVPHDLIIDRCYLHGDPIRGQRRGIALNSASTTIANSYFSDIKYGNQDAQAIAGWNGPGPFTIVNNYLEASSENFMLGGADPAIPNLVPSDVTFRQNYVTKPVSWRNQGWIIKNLFELKNAQRVTVDGNIFENNWAAAQSGFAIVLTPRNQDGKSPWSVVQQVSFTNNVVRQVAAVFNILGTDDVNQSQVTNNMTVRNNLFVDVSAATWGGSGRFVITNGGYNITFDHNTVFTDGTVVVGPYGLPVTGFTFTNNIVPDNSWAVIGDNSSPGNGTIAKYFPGGTFLGGVFVGSNPQIYPAGNYYPPTIAGVGFMNSSGGNYRLSSSSPYIRAASDGGAVGANIDAINQAAGTRY